MSKEKLINEIINIKLNFDLIVTEIDHNNSNIRHFTALSQDDCKIRYNNKTLFITKISDFVADCNRRVTEGNSLTDKEKYLLELIKAKRNRKL